MSKTIKAFVKQVQSTDTLILRTKPQNGPPVESLITLSNINGLKLGSAKEPEREEPFAFEAREFLRKLLVGKQVCYLIEYSIASIGRDFGSVCLPEEIQGESDVARLLVKNGFARVRKNDSKQSEELDYLCGLEREAITQKRGIYGDHLTLTRVLNMNPVEDMQAFLKEHQKKPIPALIEQVRDGSTYRVCLFLPKADKSTHQYITFNLSGVKAPTYRKDVPNSPDIIEPYGAEAKFFVEVRLLQKDIHVILEGISNNAFVGSVIFPLGNIAELLLSEGFAKVQDWTLSMVTAGAAPLRTAELKAREKQLRVWKDYVVKKVVQSKVLEATVTKILQADTILVEYGDSKIEKKITLSSIRAPKQKDEKEAYYNSEAREFLRSRLIGKKVSVCIDYVKPAQDQYEAKECGTIRIGEQNISESLLSKGLALVIRHKKDDDDRSSVYDSLCAAEEKAKTEQKGMHSTKESPILRIFDASENASKAKQAFPSLQRAGKVHAIVEHCVSASRFKVFIPSQNTKLTLVIAGLRAPRNARSPTEKGEPFGNEGLQFATKKLLQRDVEVSIESTDRVGGFIGNLFILAPGTNPKNNTSRSQGSNFAVLLLERGLAFVHDGSARTNSFSRALYDSQEKAKSEKIGVWSIESNLTKKEEIVDEFEDKLIPEAKDAIITERTATGFYAQIQGADLKKLSELTVEIRAFHQASHPAIMAKKGDLVCAQFSLDKQWYRAKVLSVQSETVEVLYVDYGNKEAISKNCVRAIHTFGTLPPQAVECQLACIDIEAPLLAPTVKLCILNKKDGIHQVLAYVDGECLNVSLVRDGHATVKRLQFTNAKGPLSHLLHALNEAQEYAQSKRLNIWEYGNFMQDEDLY